MDPGFYQSTFPNDYDKDLGKTGYGIWLHGVEDDSRIEKANVTEGCVAFYNADIKLLKTGLNLASRL